MNLETVPRYSHCQRCGADTREGKPYCTDHVMLMPYAQEVVRRAPEWVMEHQREPRARPERPRPKRRRRKPSRPNLARQCLLCDEPGVVARGLCVVCYHQERREGRLGTYVRESDRAPTRCPCGQPTQTYRRHCDACYARLKQGSPLCPEGCGVPVYRRGNRTRPGGCPLCGAGQPLEPEPTRCPCGRLAKARGLCMTHYSRGRRGGAPCRGCGVPMTRSEESEGRCADCRTAARRTA